MDLSNFDINELHELLFILDNDDRSIYNDNHLYFLMLIVILITTITLNDIKDSINSS